MKKTNQLKKRVLQDGEILESVEISGLTGEDISYENIGKFDQDKKFDIIVAIELFRVNPREVLYMTSRYSDVVETSDGWENILKSNEIMYVPLLNSNK